MRRKLSILIWLLLVSRGAFSQTAQYQFTRLTVNDGLSHNQVNCIMKDSRGFIWLGTLSGLNRYDGYDFKIFRHQMKDTLSLSDSYITGIFELPDQKLWINTRNGSDIYNECTETFNRNYAAYLRSLSMPDGAILSVTKDRQGNYWFLYLDGGIYCYEPAAKKTIHIYHRAGNNLTPVSDTIMAFGQDEKNDYWLVNQNGVIEEMQPGSRHIIYRNNLLVSATHGAAEQYNMFIDAQGCLWIYVSGDARGVYYFNPSKQSLQHFTKDAKTGRLNNNIVYGIIQDDKGNIWIGTDHGGINIIDKKDFSVRYLLNNPDDQQSLSQNSVYALYKDSTGIIWVGTYKKGFCYYNENLARFPLYRHQSNDPNSLSYEDINRFVEDEKGNLWIGTNGGGLIYFDRKQHTFKQFLHDPNNPNSLSNDVIIALCLDHKNKLWIGTYYGGMDCYDGKKFIHHRHDPNNPNSLANDKVWDIIEDSSHYLWVGTLGGGLDRYDPDKNIFVHYPSSSPSLPSQEYVNVIIEDALHHLWIGTAGGIDVLDPATNKIIHYGHEENDPNSLSNDNVNCLLQDNRGWIWVGTREGLSVFDTATKKFRSFTTQDGLPDNAVLTILEDNNHTLWMGTPNGLSNLIIHKKENGKYHFTFHNYDEMDGLQGREFNEKAAYKTREGELAFGGPNGFNLFDPSKIKINKNVPPVVLTGLEIFNKPVQVNKKIHGHTVLQKALPETQNITLPYNENDFSVEFAALSYSHSEKNKYAYQLEGFNKEWIITDGRQRKATYTNLDPGTYVFHVIASNNDDVWNNKGTTLHITILPPFWRTIWAYLIYILLIIAALLLARKILLERAKMNFRLEQQQREAQRMHELDMMKIRFFTNVSHEFRTPLTLILTPIDKIVKQSQDAEQKKQFQLIQRNARRLLNLVNQLLDFRKLEVQEVKLHPIKADIVRFMKDVAFSFTDIAEKKNIHFSITSSVENLETDFDPDKLERILFNLLSNAFKFTSENGEVDISIKLSETAGEKDQQLLEIKVKDTGIGIPAEKQHKIFERFFQHDSPRTMLNQGSGIGLSITKEFVRLHHGSIHVESVEGQGSCFTVLLPVHYSWLPENPAKEKMPQVTRIPLNNAIHEIAQNYHGKRPTIMLVDDNEDFRFYLKDNLQIYFNIIEAGNGKAAWEKILSAKPDLIVTDIMMPEMDGIALARKIKKDERTSRIPIILLTARTEEEQQLEGFATGANDYITKPFNFEILLSRIRNLLAEKKAAKKDQPPKLDLSPSQIPITGMDEKFLKGLITHIEEHIGDPDFSVEQLSHNMFMSRVALYKKVLTLTDKTPIELIRSIRLKRAAQFLEKSQMTVSEVAYEVGFNNPKYFTKYFKKEYSMLPSQFAQQHKNHLPENGEAKT